MPIYNSVEYSDSYSKTFGSLLRYFNFESSFKLRWFHARDLGLMA